MKVRNIGSNMTEIETSAGDLILVSYSTPVAARIDGAFYRTEKRHSVTTGRHISKWLAGASAETRPQSFFDGLI